MAHIPNQNECLKKYGLRLHSIFDKYQHVIKFGVYGHSHTPQFQVVQDMIFGKPIGVNFFPGSATTSQGKPPNFSVLEIDPTSNIPLDLKVFAMDLDHANRFNQPKWTLSSHIGFNSSSDKSLSSGSIPNLSPESLQSYTVQ